MVGHWSANSGAKDSTKHETRADETDDVGLDVKLSDDQRHRHAKDENNKAIKQRAPGREHPKPSLDGLQRRLIQQQREALR